MGYRVAIRASRTAANAMVKKDVLCWCVLLVGGWIRRVLLASAGGESEESERAFVFEFWFSGSFPRRCVLNSFFFVV